MKDFVDTAEDLLRRSPNSISADQFQLVFDLIQRRLPQLHAKSVVDLANIESVFNIIEMAQLVGRLPGTEKAEIPQAATAIRTLLTETIEQTCRFVLRGRELRPHLEYAALSAHIRRLQTNGQTVAVVTFNYDLALDYALHAARMPVDYAVWSAQAGALPLLKLHGSLNWLACSCGALLQLGVSELFSGSTFGTPLPGWATFPVRPRYGSVPRHCPEGTVITIPAIVPPSWNKTQYHVPFQVIWETAVAHLANAREITVVGYSMPPTDSFFRDLLSLGLVGESRLRRFVVVDPDEQVAARFKSVLGPDSQRVFRHEATRFTEYARETFPRDTG